MLLKIAHRNNPNKNCIICICQHRWYGKHTSQKIVILYNGLISAGLLPRTYSVRDLRLEERRDIGGVKYWSLGKLSKAKDKWIVFMQVNVMSKRRN